MSYKTVIWKSKSRFFPERWSRNRCPKSVISNRLYRFFPETMISKSMFSNIGHPNWCSRIGVSISSVKRWSRKSVFPNRCSRFLGTILLHTLGCYQPMSVSRTSVGEALNTSPDNRSLDQDTKTLLEQHSTSSPRLSSRLDILERLNAKRHHQGSRPTRSLRWVGCFYTRLAALSRRWLANKPFYRFPGRWLVKNPCSRWKRGSTSVISMRSRF